jgi:solute:Na+ symporter, SSS family
LIGTGLYHSRGQGNLREYFLASGQMKWLAVGLSLMAALNSGMDYLMQPSSVIKFGAFILIGSLSWLLVCPYVWHITLPLYRRLRAISAYEYLEHRFDLRVRILAAVIFVLWRVGWMATALYVPSLVMASAIGNFVEVNTLVMIIGVVVTFYTMLGGMKAVVWNDVIQFCIMFAGLAATVMICIGSVDGGVGTIRDQLSLVGDPEQFKAPVGRTGAWSFFLIPMTVTGYLVVVTLSRISTYTSDQVMVQRLQTSRSITDARRGFLITAATDTVWMVMLGFVGLALFAFFQARFGGLPSWAFEQPDRLFPHFMALAFPAGLAGLVIAAILAASISSIDSALNSLTSVVTVDFVERLGKGRTGGNGSPMVGEDRARVRRSRLITLILGAVGTGVACNVSSLGSLLEMSNKLINSFSGPILGIYLLGMFTRRATPAGVLFGGIAGTGITMYFAFQAAIHAVLNESLGTALDAHSGISFLWPPVFGFLATMILGYAASALVGTRRGADSERWMWRAITQQELVE